MMLLVAYLHVAGFLDWVTERVVSGLKPHHLLPTVIFLSGILSAFFVYDIICLVMVPFAPTASRRMGTQASSLPLGRGHGFERRKCRHPRFGLKRGCGCGGSELPPSLRIRTSFSSYISHRNLPALVNSAK